MNKAVIMKILLPETKQRNLNIKYIYLAALDLGYTYLL